MRLSLILAVIFVTLGFNASLHADDKSWNEWSKFGENVIANEILPEFRNGMTRAERRLLRSIDIEIPRMPYYRAFATIRSGKRIISISSSFIANAELHNQAYVLAAYFDEADSLGPYFEYLEDLFHANTESLAQGKQAKKATSFGLYLGWSDERNEVTLSSPNIKGARRFFTVEGLAFVLAHEFAHQHFDHVSFSSSASEQRRLEVEADDYAAELLIRSGFNPLAALPTMTWFYQLEGTRTEESTHPNSTCRAANSIKAGLREARSDRDFIKYARTDPNAANLLENGDNLIREMKKEYECE